MVWVEQPVGTGFSQGEPTATSEEEIAAQFAGFWKVRNTQKHLPNW
jgi:carboxypeptidase D